MAQRQAGPTRKNGAQTVPAMASRENRGRTEGSTAASRPISPDAPVGCGELAASTGAAPLAIVSTSVFISLACWYRRSRLLLQRAEHHFVQPHVNLHFLRRRGKKTDGQLAGEHLVEDHAQRVDVGAVVHFLGMLDLFGGHVVGRAHDLTGAGEVRRGSRGALTPCPTPSGRGETVRLAAHELGQPEIGDLHPAALIQQDILRLDVAMDHAGIVGVLQGVADLRHDRQGLVGSELARIQQTPQTQTVDELHEEVVQAALTPGPSPGRRGEQAALTPGPSPGRRGEQAALTPDPSPGRRGEQAALTPGPSLERRGEQAALTLALSRRERGEGLARIVDRHDARMAEHGHGPGLLGEPLGKGRILADRGREDLQRHQPVEAFLPGLVDHAHPAAAYQLQDLQVREVRGQFRGRGRQCSRRAGCCSRGGLRFQSPFQEARRAESPRHLGRQLGSAPGAPFCRAHGISLPVCFPSSSTSSRGKKRPRLQLEPWNFHGSGRQCGVTIGSVRGNGFLRQLLLGWRRCGRSPPTTAVGSGGEGGDRPLSRHFRSSSISLQPGHRSPRSPRP